MALCTLCDDNLRSGNNFLAKFSTYLHWKNQLVVFHFLSTAEDQHIVKKKSVIPTQISVLFSKKKEKKVVGTVVGGKAPTKIKTGLKKLIVNLACYPRLPVLCVAYQADLIRAYMLFSTLYSLITPSGFRVLEHLHFTQH